MTPFNDDQIVRQTKAGTMYVYFSALRQIWKVFLIFFLLGASLPTQNMESTVYGLWGNECHKRYNTVVCRKCDWGVNTFGNESVLGVLAQSPFLVEWRDLHFFFSVLAFIFIQQIGILRRFSHGFVKKTISLVLWIAINQNRVTIEMFVFNFKENMVTKFGM